MLAYRFALEPVTGRRCYAQARTTLCCKKNTLRKEETLSTVTGEIGFSPKINVFKLNSRFWTHQPYYNQRHLNPALAYFLCSWALHVKCGLLLEDLIESPNIGTVASRERNELLPKDCIWPLQNILEVGLRRLNTSPRCRLGTQSYSYDQS